MKLAKHQCSSCPFLSDGLPLSLEYMLGVYSYLLRGENHLCHSDRTDQTVCLGGRHWQLEAWYAMGQISAPTNEALAEAMVAHGVEPKEHINPR